MGVDVVTLAAAKSYTAASLKGAGAIQGKPGKNGKDGDSTYQIAVKNGFTGTEEEWLNSLKCDVTAADLQAVEAIAKGRATGYVFDTKNDMIGWLANQENTSKLVLGDNLYIRALNTPDYWWDGTTYCELETQKVNLTEYVNKNAFAFDAETATLTITI